MVLSPHAEELLKAAEDAVILGKEAEAKAAHLVDGEYGAQEISAEERSALMEVLYHKRKGAELDYSFSQ